MVEILWFPILSYKSSWLEVATKVLVLFLSLNFNFNSSSSITPFFHCLFQFFFSTFLSNFSILIFKPCLFDLLFMHIISWIVVKVVRLAFKPVLSFKNYRVSSTVKFIEWMSVYWSFFLFEIWLHLGAYIS